MVLALAVPAAAAQPTRSSPIAVAADGHVFVVNPDSSTVARLEFDGVGTGTLTHEQRVGRYPRTVALVGSHVFTADQGEDSVSRLAQADLTDPRRVDLGFGCNPYGIAAVPGGHGVVATCQGTSEAVLLDEDLGVVARVKLPWPDARAVAVSSDGARAYVTHYLTAEPGLDAHVSVVDLAQKAVAQVLAIPADQTTCETTGSGQGVFNLVSAAVLMPDDAPADVAGQLWLGGELENAVSKGLFKREPSLATQPGAALFPWVRFTPFPDGATSRNIYHASAHDLVRSAIYRIDPRAGTVVGKLDLDGTSIATDIELSADGRAQC